MLRITISALLFFSIVTANGQVSNQEASKKLSTFFRYVQLAYVDTVNGEELAEDAIRAILKDLDPHSVYISKKDLKKMNEPLEGNFEGIGIQFNILHDTIVVVSPISGGPSEKLGIRAGDKIIEINDETVAGVGFTNKDVTDNLRGKKGTQVEVGIKRSGEDQLLDYTITRDKIPIYSVDAAYMADPETGYLKLNRFSATSMGEITTALDSLSKLGMENLILDLRGNAGGYLKTAVDLSDYFLSKGKLMVYTEGRSYPREDYISTSAGNYEKGKLIILIDEGTASASEIVSGAVQDWDRGLIMGRRSFGKGLVQKPFSLGDGSAIRLTVSRYYTPSGRSIQRPYDEGGKAYYEEIYNRLNNGELTDSDSIDLPDSLMFKTLESKRTVYGGGGIMPDIFVPLDTTEFSDLYSLILRKGLLNTYSLDFLDVHRISMQQDYPTFEDFDKKFNIEGERLEDFKAYLKKENIEINETEFTTSQNLITTYLKALIARSLWGSTEFYRVSNPINKTYREALKTMHSDSFKAEGLKSD
ncbi:MAG TPA: peptidase S41 [Flavobacteriales bacterium]|jgi:carboxyl-terminal processing protease|nr:peptidase S41 [Flavobacteriales bacterium]